MAKQLEKLHKTIIQKQELLNNAKEILKKEFIGIDRVIDEIIDSISSWFLFPDLQEKPIVINLWGLTGVGKSALVNRLAPLLRLEEKYWCFDLGDSDNTNWAVKRQLEEIYDNVNGYPIMIALDEFQHARTINESEKEINKPASRIVWQLLDSGKFQISRYNSGLALLFDLTTKLHYFLRNGVRVSNGKVVSKKEYFVKEMELEEEYKRFRRDKNKLDIKNIFFVPTSFHEDLYSLAKEKFDSPFDVKTKLSKLNGYETLQFLSNIIEFANSPKTVDCSKALIFVLGNLDEAYTMSDDYNPDMNADEFHEQSLKINVPDIKKALKWRFRNEQIARLGNMHIIYPAFSSSSFRAIIQLELKKISNKVYKQQKVQLEFDDSIIELIYKEGVYPTQGTRPIFSTIHQIINTKLGRVITEMILNKLSPDKISFRAENDLIVINYWKNCKAIHSITEKQTLNLEKLRKNRKDDVQAITAVHESGHAIISAILLNTIPEVIYSTTAEAGSSGFVYTKFKWKYISRKEIKYRLAHDFGGFAGEKLVFGQENVTTGAEEDIRIATKFISKMLKECGMGKITAAYQAKQPKTIHYLHDETNAVNDEMEKWLKSAMELAEKTLKEEELLLLKMADYLCDNRTMNKEQTRKMILKYASNFDENSIIENGDCLFYRKHLKNKVLSLEAGQKEGVDVGSYEFSLNKKST